MLRLFKTQKSCWTSNSEQLRSIIDGLFRQKTKLHLQLWTVINKGPSTVNSCRNFTSPHNQLKEMLFKNGLILKLELTKVASRSQHNFDSKHKTTLEHLFRPKGYALKYATLNRCNTLCIGDTLCNSEQSHHETLYSYGHSLTLCNSVQLHLSHLESPRCGSACLGQ